jgi:hypothetical protein
MARDPPPASPGHLSRLRGLEATGGRVPDVCGPAGSGTRADSPPRPSGMRRPARSPRTSPRIPRSDRLPRVRGEAEWLDSIAVAFAKAVLDENEACAQIALSQAARPRSISAVALKAGLRGDPRVYLEEITGRIADTIRARVLPGGERDSFIRPTGESRTGGADEGKQPQEGPSRGRRGTKSG